MKRLIPLYIIIVIFSYFYYTDTREITIIGGGALMEEQESRTYKEVDYTGIHFMSKDKDLPVVKVETKTKNFETIIYGYNSEESQTDNTPNITASGQKTRDGIIANNCLAFGTKVKIDDRIYEVQDRMNSKYGCEVFDIWFAEKQNALDWGKQNKIITIQ